MSEIVAVERSMLGGRVGVHLGPATRSIPAAEHAASAALDRVAAWSRRLTRFDPGSDLSMLNATQDTRAAIRPTLAAVLDWARAAESATDGIVSVALLDQRLDAELGRGEAGAAVGPSPKRPGWRLDRRARSTIVERPRGLRLDLDGVAKGWLADRAVARLPGWPLAIVDADGDVALAMDRGRRTTVAVASPFDPSLRLIAIELANDGPGRQRCGVATSGTTVHRWGSAGRPRHHLIDPRTGRPAVTDLVQATVVASSARLAEALAKAAVIVGSAAAVDLLRRSACQLAVLARTDGSAFTWVPGSDTAVPIEVAA